ncbi:MAG: holliday junction helicase RuvA [Patescibacteria group bacterium]|nr:holliday junction helicase RuvA [Patescibacteria group bacterium]
MYSFVRGTVLAFDDGKISLLVENTGLGLELQPTPLLFASSSLGEVVEAHLYHHVTDVSEALFAFANAEEKRFFRKLLKVDGVGGKTALSMLGLGLSPLIRAIETGDEKMIATVPGIGKKTALKVIVELKSEVSGSDIIASDTESKSEKRTKKSPSDVDKEAILLSLTSMGYDRRAVEAAIDAVAPEGLSVGERTVLTLKALSK